MPGSKRSLLDVLNNQRVARGLAPLARSAATDALGWIEPRRLYGLVAEEKCAARDFMSHEELGRPVPPRPDDRLTLSWTGVSAFLTMDSAIKRSKALRKGWLAVLEMTPELRRRRRSQRGDRGCR